MRSYPRRDDLDFSKTVFNNILSSNKKTMECAFNILTKKFGIFQTETDTSVRLAEATIKKA